MKRKRAAVLFTGGKDSCLALYKASREFDIEYLLALIPETSDSYMFHKSDEKLLGKQAEMLGKKLLIGYSKGEKELELEDMKMLIDRIRGKVDVLVVGGIASNYQSKRIKKIADIFNLEIYAPLWTYTAEKLWKELLDLSFKVIIVKIACEGLSREILGKVIDEKMLAELKRKSKQHGFTLDFEGGDAETAVLFMPGFKKEIGVRGKIESEDKYRHFLRIMRVE